MSVVVVHYEQQRELDRTLLALRRQTYPSSRLEIIVVDDGSAAPPVVPDDVRLVLQEDRGFRLAAARNAGAAVASGDILCFVDADTAPEPDYVRELTRLPTLAPDVVAVGLRRHAELSRLAPDARLEHEASAHELASPRWLAEAYARTHDLRDADDRSYRFVIGAVVGCDAALFRATGGFDESFESYGGEDWEWAYRAWLAGALFAHVPTAVAWHDGPEWAERTEEATRAKNREAMTLARLIPVPGSGPRGLTGPYADVVVTVPPGIDSAAAPWFVTLDSISAEVPLAALPGDPRSLDRRRLTVAVQRPFRARVGALERVFGQMSRDSLGELVVVDAGTSEVLCVIRSAAADARAARWGRTDLVITATLVIEGLQAVTDDVDVEAYLGGWG